MFEGDLGELDTADLLTAASEFARVQERAAVRMLEAALAFADRNGVADGDGDGEVLPGTERIRVYGGAGCPGVAEFAPLEFGAVLGLSSGAAAAFIGEALALRHRLPRIWAAVLAGNAMAWRARKVAQACLSLSLEAAAIVDRRVVGIVNTVAPSRLAAIVKAAVWQADPDLARAAAELAAQERGVFVGPSDHHGTKRFWVRAAAGDVIRFDATIDDLARALKTLGDPDPLDQRRAKAIGWIADPAAAHHLLQVARHLARTLPTQPSDTVAPAADPGTHDRPAANNRSAAHNRSAMDDHAAGIDYPAGDHDPARDDWRGPGAACASDDWLAPADHRATDARAGDDYPARDDWPDPDDRHAPDDWCGAEDLDAPVGTEAPDAAVEDGFTRQALAGSLAARLAAIKHDAYSQGLGAGSRRRANRHTLYVHLTDTALATGTGVLRVEELGPLLVHQLSELLGHDQIVVKPVIDLHDQVSVHSYEIPDRIRERVRLRHPVDMFPYSAAEATTRMDQDHITPYHRTGPPAQTNTDNLIPEARLHHRAKTFGDWSCRRLPTGAIEWTSPHGLRFLVDHTGTHPLPAGNSSPHPT